MQSLQKQRAALLRLIQLVREQITDTNTVNQQKRR